MFLGWDGTETDGVDGAAGADGTTHECQRAGGVGDLAGLVIPRDDTQGLAYDTSGFNRLVATLPSAPALCVSSGSRHPVDDCAG